jgi:hypothetical protein
MSGTVFNECSASELMELLINRGYFHQGGLAEPVQEQDFMDDSMDAMRRQPPASFPMEDCDIITTYDSRYLTLNALTQQLHTLLEESGGRLSKTKASMMLAVNVDSIDRVLPNDVTILGDEEIMTEQYFDEQTRVICSRLAQSENGCLALSEIANQLLHLPTDFCLSFLQTRMDGMNLNARIMNLHGAKTLVTRYFDSRERVRIRGTLRALTVPTPMDALSSSLGWDMAYVLPVVRELCNLHEVDGVFREHQSSGGNHGMYTPRTYEVWQRTSVDELFQMQGYITLEKCQAMGIPSFSMGTFVTKSFPSAVCLTNSMIASNVVIEPLVAIIQECLEEMSFVDLKLHIAEALLRDVRELISDHVLPQLPRTNSAGGGGELVLSPGEALFVSQAMIQRLSTRILPPLIQSFAKRRAIEMLDQGMNSGDANNDSDMKGAQKGKKKSKKSSAQSKSGAAMEDHTSHDIVPLSTVSRKLAEEEPELGFIQKSHGQIAELNNEEEFHAWELDEATDSGPLQAFCRIAFFTDDFRKSCARAVEAELELLRSRKKAISVHSYGAARTRSIESSFEVPSCFNAACFQLQAHAKFLDYLTTTDIDDDALSACKQLFLVGCCTNFAQRITQYCLFRNEMEEGIFVFETSQEELKEDVSIGLPSYCREVDITQMHFPTPVLRCLEDEDGKFKDPRATLRAVLSGNLGVTLARAWTLCGGKCYDGGIPKPSEDAESDPPGDVAGFIAHIDENCL